MALKNFNPTSPGRRGLVLVDKSDLWKGKPEKSLTEGLSSNGGRNNKGRITARRRGGRHKRRYRNVFFGGCSLIIFRKQLFTQRNSLGILQHPCSNGVILGRKYTLQTMLPTIDTTFCGNLNTRLCPQDGYVALRQSRCKSQRL